MVQREAVLALGNVLGHEALGDRLGAVEHNNDTRVSERKGSQRHQQANYCQTHQSGFKLSRQQHAWQEQGTDRWTMRLASFSMATRSSCGIDWKCVMSKCALWIDFLAPACQRASSTRSVLHRRGEQSPARNREEAAAKPGQRTRLPDVRAEDAAASSEDDVRGRVVVAQLLAASLVDLAADGQALVLAHILLDEFGNESAPKHACATRVSNPGRTNLLDWERLVEEVQHGGADLLSVDDGVGHAVDGQAARVVLLQHARVRGQHTQVQRRIRATQHRRTTWGSNLEHPGTR